MEELKETYIKAQTKVIIGQKYFAYQPIFESLLTDYLINIKKKNNINSLDFIQSLHEDVFVNLNSNIAGILRSKETKKHELYSKNISLMKLTLVKKSLISLNTKYPCSFKMTTFEIADYHNKVIKIHPFVEGNLIISKLIMLGHCIQNGYKTPLLYGHYDQRLYNKGIFNSKIMEKLILKHQ